MIYYKQGISLLLFTILSVTSGFCQSNSMYKTSIVRAAPGKLLDLIEYYKNEITVARSSGADEPVMMRHSQGDQWDLLILQPIMDLDNSINPAYGSKYYDMIAWKEDIFGYGPEHQDFKNRINEGRYYHVEMFVSLAGKQKELLKEREMENQYLRLIERPENLIFTRDMGGGKFDIFTIGIYKDIKHYAESADIPEDKKQEAAIKAGFEGADKIGIYLRTLINEHHDTLAGRVE